MFRLLCVVLSNFCIFSLSVNALDHNDFEINITIVDSWGSNLTTKSVNFDLPELDTNKKSRIKKNGISFDDPSEDEEPQSFPKMDSKLELEKSNSKDINSKQGTVGGNNQLINLVREEIIFPEKVWPPIPDKIKQDMSKFPYWYFERISPPKDQDYNREYLKDKTLGTPTSITKYPYNGNVFKHNEHRGQVVLLSLKHVITFLLTIEDEMTRYHWSAVEQTYFYSRTSGENYTIRLGSSYIHSGGIVFKGKWILLHPMYTYGTAIQTYKFGLIELNERVKLSASIQIAKLRINAPVNYTCRYAAWERSDYEATRQDGTQFFYEQLQESLVFVIDPNTGLCPQCNVTDSICVGWYPPYRCNGGYAVGIECDDEIIGWGCFLFYCLCVDHHDYYLHSYIARASVLYDWISYHTRHDLPPGAESKESSAKKKEFWKILLLLCSLFYLI